MKLKILVLLLLFATQSTFAANVKFYHINSLHRSSIRQVTSICKDDNGFIWASSRMGVMRVIEDSNKIYHLPTTSSDMVYVHLAYSSPMLWAYTNNGQFFLYNEVLDTFELLFDLRAELQLDNIGIFKITITESGLVLIPTTEGLYSYEDREIQKLEVGTNEIIELFADYDENSYICASQYSIFFLNKKTLKANSLIKFQKKYDVNSLYFDRDFNTIWFGTALDGLYYIELNTIHFSERKVSGVPNQLVKAIEDSGRSSLYIGIDGQGVWEISKAKKIPVNIYKEDIDNPFSINGNGVYDIYCDNEKDRVWVATYSGGLSYFVKDSPYITQIVHQTYNPNCIGNNDISQIVEDRDENLWFATADGLYRWRIRENKWEAFYSGDAKAFTSVTEDNEGRIWASSFVSGIYCLDRHSGRELAYYPDEFPGTKARTVYIMSMLTDSEGDLWMGGISSLVCYSHGSFKIYDTPPIHSLEEFKEGKILLGTTEGLYLLDKGTGELKALLSSLTEDIEVDGNTIWAATSGDGLIKYDFEQNKAELLKSAMPSAFVSSVKKIGSDIWLGTENGLCRYHPETEAVNTYYSYFNPSNLSFNVSAVERLRNGNVIWGTNNGAVLFNPDVLASVKLSGKLYLQNILVSGQSLRRDPESINNTPVDKLTSLDLKYGKNEVMIPLVAIGASLNEVFFSWKMEGLDEGWRSPENQQNILSYINIPTGEYKLRIRMYDSSKSYILDERLIDINVTPLFWQTKSFAFLILLAVLIAVAIIVFFIISRLNHRHAEDKIQFFTGTAHDLRNAISLIVAPIVELGKDTNLSERAKYYLDLVKQHVDQLNDVATQLLDFQKVDTGKSQLYLQMEDIVKIVGKQISIYKTSAERKNLKLSFKTNLQSYLCAVDRSKIDKVIDNLLSNAVKFSKSGSSIEAELICTKDEWTLSIKDYGIGIPASSQRNLFKEFYRGNNTVNSHTVGSGIGLVLVKNYTEMHSGTVSVVSKENVGSTFTITIPYNIVSCGQEQVIAAPSIDNTLTEEVETPQIDETAPTVLVVDDNGDLLRFLKTALELHYTVLTASDGQQAWDIIQTQAPDLVVSDIMMPGIDGFELCKLVKSTFETSHIPIILLSALGEKTNKLEGLGLGAEDYITKPFDMNILEERIRTIVRNRELVREKAIKAHTTGQDSIVTNKLNDEFIKKAIEVVHNNMSNPDFSKDDFAKEMCVSTSLLYKKIKFLTDLSPINFLKSIRMNHAMELLKTHEYSVVEVSERCGYSSQSYFTTTFKSFFNITPSEVK